MSKSSYSELLASARVMVDGLKQRADVVASVGLTEAKTKELEDLTSLLATLNSEQESLKAALKTKTAAVEKAQNELRALMGSTKKLVKVAVEKNDWLTFGISDKQ